MSKAEDLAKELYPDWEMTGVSNVDGQEESMVRIQRVAYIKGYHQAEKDLELTWENVKEIYCIALNLREHVGSSVFGQPFYEEVLKQFKDFKERKY